MEEVEVKGSGQCSICFEYWSSSGEHQLVVTKCGHLFGLSCITKWIEQKSTKNRICPICKSKILKNSLTKICGVTEITIFENKERDKLKIDLKTITDKFKGIEKENKIKELEVRSLRQKVDSQEKEIIRLKALLNFQTHQNNRLNNEIKNKEESNNNNIINNSINQFSQFRPYKLTDIVHTFQSRVCEISGSQLLIIMDTSKSTVNNKTPLHSSPNNTPKYPSNSLQNSPINKNNHLNNLNNNINNTMNNINNNINNVNINNINNNSQYSNGLIKISMLDINVKEQIWNHNGQIRDLKISPFGSPQILSASMDKTMRISDLRSHCTLLTFPLEQSAWSCEWNANDDNFLYAGLNNTTVAIYDIRSTKGAVEIISPPSNLFGPINSLISLGSLPSVTLPTPSTTSSQSSSPINRDFIIAGTATSAAYYCWSDPSSFSSILYPADEGKRSLVSKNTQNNSNFLISYSKSSSHPKPSFKFLQTKTIAGKTMEKSENDDSNQNNNENNTNDQNAQERREEKEFLNEYAYLTSDEDATVMMSKSAFYSLDNEEVIAIPTSNGITIRDVSSQSILQTIPRSQFGEISNIKAFSSLPSSLCGQKRTYSSFAGKDYLYALTNSQLMIYER